MNTTRDSIGLTMTTESGVDPFGQRLKQICQLFRFYSSVILVIVGERLSNLNFQIEFNENYSLVLFFRNDRFSSFDQSFFIDKNSTKFIERISYNK